jgi:hypothetical protein
MVIPFTASYAVSRICPDRGGLMVAQAGNALNFLHIPWGKAAYRQPHRGVSCQSESALSSDSARLDRKREFHG